MNSLSHALAQSAKRVPNRAAIAFGETTIPYAQLADSVDQLAAGLQNLGVTTGDRVALVMPNCPQFIMTYFATVRLGAAVVPFNPMLTPPEARYVVADSGAKTIAAIKMTAPLANAIAAQNTDLQHVIVSGEETTAGAISFEELLGAEPNNLPDMPGPEDLAALIYTSGTTGKPKGAMLTHGNLMCNAEACLESIGLGDDDVLFATLPLFHSYGALTCMILSVFAGVPVVVVPKFESLPALEALERGRVTFFPAVPAMFAMLAQIKTARKFDLSSLRKCLSGGAALSADVAQAFKTRWGCPILEGYGPTEASPVVSVNRTVSENKPGSVGPPLPGVEVEIRDDDGHPLPVGEVGEICVRGGNVMQGYWRDEKQTANTLKGEWLLTGDLGRVDEDSHIYIVDRKKDLVIVGGLNVYPREVEDCILEMPQVRDVAVVGMKTPLHGERIRACIELHEGAELAPSAVVEHCAGQLAHFKTPRLVDIFDQLPRNALGKILKRELRDIPTKRA